MTEIKQDKTLIFACENNDLDLVKLMLNYGADVHTCMDLPLRISSKRGYLNIVKYLLSMDANINAKDKEAFKNACENYHYNVVYCIVEASKRLEKIVDV